MKQTVLHLTELKLIFSEYTDNKVYQAEWDDYKAIASFSAGASLKFGTNK